MEENKTTLKPYLTPLTVWALSFGCAVGWGSFIMPGTTFLPIGGPAGTVIGMIIGGFLMFIIGKCYYYMMKIYPDSGGAYTYTKKIFGYSHGFFNAWFLCLTYVAILWANMTALSLINRHLLGSLFQFGFHYTVAGYDVYFGEILLEILFLLLAFTVCSRMKRTAGTIQTVAAIVLISAIILCFIVAIASGGNEINGFKPAFSQNGRSPLLQVISIVLLAPWAIVGFESISNSVGEYKFKVNKTKKILIAALISGFAAYIMLTIIGASAQPLGYLNWNEYISDLGNNTGVKALPVFYAINVDMGKAGIVLLGIAIFCGIITGMIGLFTASSRLMYSMSKDDMMPRWFGGVGRGSTPNKAMLFILIISLAIPFLGRTAIGWVVDVTTVGVIIAYTYTSAATLKYAKKDKSKKHYIIGLVGFIISVIYFLVFMIPNPINPSTLAPESYIVLVVWVFLGFLFLLNRYSSVRLKSVMHEREKELAEENARAKSTFLSNMSHDIRTPMNAIIGYINLSKAEGTTFEQTKEYLNKIEAASHHMLALINDVLEMSRIESGKIDLEQEEHDLKKIMMEVDDIFATQMKEKNINFGVDYSGVKNRSVMIDKTRFNRVLFNLLSNSFKFTPNDGEVWVTLTQESDVTDDKAAFCLSVKDTGIGMSEEFAKNVFESFERERTSTVSGIEGTGLGMAITKNIVELMGGTIEVKTQKGVGTEFIIRFELECGSTDFDKEDEKADRLDEAFEIDFSKMRVLLVEDMEINREIATVMLEGIGFKVESVMNGQEAVDRIVDSDKGYFDVVLMDIQMPVLNGYDATKKIRGLEDKYDNKIPIIAMTANAFEEDRKKAASVGMDGHIAKPIDISEVISTITGVLGERRLEERKDK